MSVNLRAALNDSAVDAMANSSQRYLVIWVSTTARQGTSIPINLCLVLDRSGSMEGEPLYQVREAAKHIVDQLSLDDFLSIIAFADRAEVVVSHQPVKNKNRIKSLIDTIEVRGGTCIDGGMKAGISEIQKLTRGPFIHKIFVLTDGFNEHGSDQECFSVAETAIRQDVTFSTFGVGINWNSELLEKIADVGNGRMHHVERPDEVIKIFGDEVRRLQSIGVINARLRIILKNGVRLGELDPVYQVFPDVILQKPEHITGYEETRLPVAPYEVKLGSLSEEQEKVFTTLVYLPKMQQEGTWEVADMYLVYDDPPRTNVSTPLTEVSASYVTPYTPKLLSEVKPYLDRLGVYKQQRLAEKLAAEGKQRQAATLLQTASKTLMQGGDQKGATILQNAATKLMQGKDLDAAEKIKTKIVSKTVLQ